MLSRYVYFWGLFDDSKTKNCRSITSDAEEAKDSTNNPRMICDVIQRHLSHCHIVLHDITCFHGNINGTDGTGHVVYHTVLNQPEVIKHWCWIGSHGSHKAASSQENPPNIIKLVTALLDVLARWLVFSSVLHYHKANTYSTKWGLK